MEKIPRRLQRVLWSYDIRKMNTRTSKNLIIQQVLNFGDFDDLKWLYHTYPERDLRRVVKDPCRGMWHDNVLNFWCLMLKVRLPRITRERAIRRMDFRPDLFPASYFRKRRRH